MEFALPADLGIAGAESLKGRLLEALHQPGPLRVQAAQVERVHAASLQLLAAFARSRRQAGLDWCWGEVAQPLQQAAARLGLGELLGLARPGAAIKEKQ